MTDNKPKGFTIIEVVLVLAIAGLIFLVVFLALPSLQKSQRDTQRKNDVGRTISAINSYMGNSRGKLPDFSASGEGSFIKSDYLGSFSDPSGGDYKFKEVDIPSSGVYGMSTEVLDTATEGEMGYDIGRNCDGEASGSRSVSIFVRLESGGFYCENT